MAKNEEVDQDEVEAGEDTAALVEAAARKKKLILLGIIGAVLLLVAGGGTWFALRMLHSEKPPEAAAKTEEHDSKDAEKEKGGAHKKAYYEVLDPAFLANYQVAGRSHYLQTTLAVMARDQGALDAVHSHMPLLRNRIVMLLSGESFEQLQTDEGRVQLQQQLLSAIQEIMKKETGKPQIEQVYYTAFVVQ